MGLVLPPPEFETDKRSGLPLYLISPAEVVFAVIDSVACTLTVEADVELTTTFFATKFWALQEEALEVLKIALSALPSITADIPLVPEKLNFLLVIFNF